MSESLILIRAGEDAGMAVVATDAARALIEEALATGALIGQVRTPDDNADAVKAQQAIKAVQKQIETAHRAAKDPLVQLGRKLDNLKTSLLGELERECARIGQLAAEFALAERRRVAAEEILAKEALSKLEAEKMKAIAATSDPVQQQQVIQDFAVRAAMELPLPSAPTRATGQRVREEWEIKVINIVEFARWAFASGRWDTLDMSIRKTPIKELLDGGMTAIPGLECKKVSKAGVSLPRGQKEIDV